MCILITKPRGVQFPPIEAIQNSIANNPDGFAVAYNHGGRIETYKTMSAARFIRAYKRLTSTLDTDDTAMIIHARIATHGAVGLPNCHCWLSFENTPKELAFAHNGILSVPTRDGLTDSETFLRDYFEPAFVRGGWSTASEIIRRKIGGSKFAFIDRAGNIRSYGQFIADGGCYYSNRSYEHTNMARYSNPRYWKSETLAI